MVSVKVTLTISCVFLSVFDTSLGQDESNLVQLTTGPVRGWRMQSGASSGTYMYAYKGIPFAEPPTGKRRFMAPVAIRRWTEEKNLSLTDAPDCPHNQPPWFPDAVISEDCLTINVYTPETAQSLPVMVWIYGGALEGGSSSYANFAPDYLVEQGVIFVSFNYRVGALGFLNLNTKQVPGNAGLQDQHLALKWVKREIGNFGGDKNQVTLFGQSAGSTCVSFHYISPKSQGLFARAICESGNTLSETSFLEDGFLDRAKEFASKLKCNDKSGAVNLTCLQNAPLADVLAYQTLNLSDEYTIPGNSISFPATVDVLSDSAILTDTPENLIASLIRSNRTRVPLILGANKDEGTLQVTNSANVYSELHSKLKYFIPTSVRALKSETEIQTDVASIFQDYFNGTEPSLTNMDGYIKLYGDKMFKVPTARFTRQIADFGKVYVYHFDYAGNFTNADGPFSGVNISGTVGHGEELNYLFYMSPNRSSTPETSPDKITLRRMVKLWTNFAKYGDPTPNSTDSVLNDLKWTPISNESVPYLFVTNDVKMSADNFLEHEVAFWSKIEAKPSFSSQMCCSVVLLLVALLGKMLF